MGGVGGKKKLPCLKTVTMAATVFLLLERNVGDQGAVPLSDTGRHTFRC